MQLTMKKMGIGVLVASLLAAAAVAFALATPATATAAEKTEIRNCDIELDYKSDMNKYYKDAFSNNLTKQLNATSSTAHKYLTYNGKAKKPNIKVYYEKETAIPVQVIDDYGDDGNPIYTTDYDYKYENITLKKGKDYTVKYYSNKQVGVGYLIVKGKGNYTGSESMTFSIYPKAPAIGKVTGGKKQITVNLKKLNAKTTSGYIVDVYKKSPLKDRDWRYDDDDSSKPTYHDQYKWVKAVAVSGTNPTVTIKGLSKKTQYYVVARTFKDCAYNYQTTINLSDYGYKKKNGEWEYVSPDKPKYGMTDDAGTRTLYSDYSVAKKVKTK